MLHIFVYFFELLPSSIMDALLFQTVFPSFSKLGRASPLLFYTTRFAVNSYYSQFIADGRSCRLGLLFLPITELIYTFIVTLTNIFDLPMKAVSDCYCSLVEGHYIYFDTDELITRNCDV